MEFDVVVVCGLDLVVVVDAEADGEVEDGPVAPLDACWMIVVVDPPPHPATPPMSAIKMIAGPSRAMTLRIYHPNACRTAIKHFESGVVVSV